MCFHSKILEALPEIIGAAVGVLGAYGIYQVQRSNDLAKNKKEKIDQDRKAVFFLKNKLSNLIDRINGQTIEFDSYVAKLRESKYQVQAIPIGNFLNEIVRVADSINKESTYFSYLSIANTDSKILNEQYFRISREVDYLERSINFVIKDAERAINYNYSRIVAHEKLFNQLKDSIYNLSNIQFTTTKFLDIQRAFVSYNEKFPGLQPPNVIHENLTEILIGILDGTVFSDNLFEKNVQEILISFNISYLQIVGNTEKYAKEIEETNDGFKDSLTKLRTIYSTTLEKIIF